MIGSEMGQQLQEKRFPEHYGSSESLVHLLASIEFDLIRCLCGDFTIVSAWIIRILILICPLRSV